MFNYHKWTQKLPCIRLIHLAKATFPIHEQLSDPVLKLLTRKCLLKVVKVILSLHHLLTPPKNILTVKEMQLEK